MKILMIIARYIVILLTLLSATGIKAQEIYFPPVNPELPWDTLSPSSMNWCTDKITPLYDFLEQENTKGFIVLKDGKIILEKYFGTFVQDSLWYWASAGKTITSFLTGKAQEEGYLSIHDSSSRFLGRGWTSCTPEQEGKITIWNQLTMTTGLDDGVPDNHCTLDTCLQYLADPGTRWAYHNAPYTLLDKVIETATSVPLNAYTQVKLTTLTGMAGFWYKSGYDNLFISNARSMARFGLLAMNHFVWDHDPLMNDTAYIRQMTATSQELNLSYGYLWWLNGKSSYMVPESQIVIPGSWAPQAPSDMFAALGKNGQILSISPSKGLVIVRMGNQPDSPSSEITTLFCNQIWEKLNDVMCGSNPVPGRIAEDPHMTIYPNPAKDRTIIVLDGVLSADEKTMILTDISGKEVLRKKIKGNKTEIDCSSLKGGFYFCRILGIGIFLYQKLIIQ